MAGENNQLGWEDLEDFGKSFFQGYGGQDTMNAATKEFVQATNTEKPLTPYGQSLVIIYLNLTNYILMIQQV